MRGTVYTWNDRADVGILATSDGQRFSFYEPGFAPGDTVDFETKQGNFAPFAVNLKRVTPTPKKLVWRPVGFQYRWVPE